MPLDVVYGRKKAILQIFSVSPAALQCCLMTSNEETNNAHSFFLRVLRMAARSEICVFPLQDEEQARFFRPLTLCTGSISSLLSRKG